MKSDIESIKAIGADGVVIGILRANGTVDVERCTELVDSARPLSVTFHRAFDMTKDPFQALDDVIASGCNRILTSGQHGKSRLHIVLKPEGAQATEWRSRRPHCVTFDWCRTRHQAVRIASPS